MPTKISHYLLTVSIFIISGCSKNEIPNDVQRAGLNGKVRSTLTTERDGTFRYDSIFVAYNQEGYIVKNIWKITQASREGGYDKSSYVSKYNNDSKDGKVRVLVTSYEENGRNITDKEITKRLLQNGNKLTETSYFEGDIDSETVYYWKNGVVVREEYSKQGEKVSEKNYQWENGRVVREELRSVSDTSEKEIVTYTYENTKEFEKKKCVYGRNVKTEKIWSICEQERIKLDEYGNPITVIITNEYNEREESYEYEYDSHNNWIRKKYNDGEFISVYERIIEYYDDGNGKTEENSVVGLWNSLQQSSVVVLIRKLLGLSLSESVAEQVIRKHFAFPKNERESVKLEEIKSIKEWTESPSYDYYSGLGRGAIGTSKRITRDVTYPKPKHLIQLEDAGLITIKTKRVDDSRSGYRGTEYKSTHEYYIVEFTEKGKSFVSDDILFKTAVVDFGEINEIIENKDGDSAKVKFNFKRGNITPFGDALGLEEETFPDSIMLVKQNDEWLILND